MTLNLLKRSEKGSKLTSAEHDANLTAIETAVNSDYIKVTGFDPTGVINASTIVQDACTAAVAAGHGRIFIPRSASTTLLKFDDAVFLPAGMREICHAPGVEIRKSAASASVSRSMIYTANGDLTGLKIRGGKFTTAQTTVANASGLLNFDGFNFEDITLEDLTFVSGGDEANCVLVKSGVGKTVKNFRIRNNTVTSCGRIAFEVINHDNVTQNITDVWITDNKVLQATLMGVSLSGIMSGGEVSGNTFKNCTSVGVEVVEAEGISVIDNWFAGTMASMISISAAYSVAAKSLVISGNKTVGRVTGKVFVSQVTRPRISNNTWSLTGPLELSGTSCVGAVVVGNDIDSTGNYAIIADNSPSHHIIANALSTASSATNFSVVRMNGASSTGTTLINNRLKIGTGGGYTDAVSGASFLLSVGNMFDSSLEPPYAKTVATLPAATGWQGAYTRQIVTDANATTFNSIVAGGGANVVPVFSDGTNWRIG